jgi:hypothetical protein
MTARVRGEGGFSLIELLVAALITTTVVGSAAILASRVQVAYSSELGDAAVQQEARFALDWIARTLAAAGSNPYNVATSACPAAGTVFAAIRLDPDGDGIHDDVRVQADVNPPNGLLVGVGGAGGCDVGVGGAGGCDDESGEDITIAHDPVNLVLTRRDRATDAAPVAVTDRVFTQLQFTYLTVNRVATTTPADIAYVQVALTGRSRSRNLNTRQFSTFTYQSEVRIRAR